MRFNTKDTVFRNEKQARIWIYRNQLEKRNLKDVDRIKVAMALAEELEEEATKNSSNNNRYIQEKSQKTGNESINECCVRNTRKNETPKESQNRRNKNRVNAHLADLVGVSTWLWHYYKSWKERLERIKKLHNFKISLRCAANATHRKKYLKMKQFKKATSPRDNTALSMPSLN